MPSQSRGVPVSQPGNTPRRDALPSVEKPLYIVGELAQDICRITGFSLDPAGKFLDVSRMHWADRLRVTLALVMGHYYCDTQLGITRPINQCMGCQAGWEMTKSTHGFPLHRVADGYSHEVIGCTKDLYL